MSKLHMRATFLLVTVLSLIPVVDAQQIGNPTVQMGVNPPQTTMAIRNAHIITVTGADIDNGVIIIRDGKIEAVGTNVSIPSGAQEIDARGMTVFPGMFDAGTSGTSMNFSSL